MKRFIDVKPSDWFYDDVIEASNTILSDGKPLMTGLPYTKFTTGAPFVYEEIKSKKGQASFTINKYLVDNSVKGCPIYVFVDGTQTTYKKISYDTKKTKTTIDLYIAPKEGAIVAIASPGIPTLDIWGRPIYTPEGDDLKGNYPVVVPKYYKDYVWQPQTNNEYLIGPDGKYLRKASVPNDEANLSGQQLAEKYIGFKEDVYLVQRGLVYLPFDLYHKTVTFKYSHVTNDLYKYETETLKSAESNEVLHTDRFFPYAPIERWRMYQILNRLRHTFYETFTDSEPIGNIYDEDFQIEYTGQRTLELSVLPSIYVSGDTKPILTIIRDDGTVISKLIEGKDYKFNNNIVFFLISLKEGTLINVFAEKNVSTEFVDVNKPVKYFLVDENKVLNMDGGNGLWADDVIEYSSERFGNNESLIPGYNIFELESKTKLPHIYGHLSSGTGKFLNRFIPKLTSGKPYYQYFMPLTFVDKASTVNSLDKMFRWSKERFLD